MSAPAEIEYLPAIRDASGDPQRLEALYQRARTSGTAVRFRAAMEASYDAAPDNVLLGAWHYRLDSAVHDARLRGVEWRLAVPISILLGLAYWAISDPRWYVTSAAIPLVLLLWAPLAAVAILWYLTLATRGHYLRAALLTVGLAAVTAYVLAVALYAFPGASGGTYLTLMVLHVPLLAACAVGLAVLGWGSAANQRFALLTKAIEVVATAGVAAIALGIFVGLTAGIFSAIGVTIPLIFLRLLVGGGAGLIPVLAVAAVYDPRVAPMAQEFRRGFGRLLTILMRALLPPTLLVLVIYLAVIPFNLAQPFVNRDVLLVFNVLLFAVAALLVGVIPVQADDLSPWLARWLRAGIAALTGLVVLVSLYALAAVLYRTFNGHVLTMNRAVVIGWNVVNIALLIALFGGLLRPGTSWVERAHGTIRLGTAAYLVWALLLTLALPWVLPG
jgi:hypothetical protein